MRPYKSKHGILYSLILIYHIPYGILAIVVGD